MQISRFVVGYDDVRPNEHVLYSVLHDRYVGIDADIRSAIARWVSGKPAQGEDEREVRAALLDQGVVRLRRGWQWQGEQSGENH